MTSSTRPHAGQGAQLLTLAPRDADAVPHRSTGPSPSGARPILKIRTVHALGDGGALRERGVTHTHSAENSLIPQFRKRTLRISPTAPCRASIYKSKRRRARQALPRATDCTDRLCSGPRVAHHRRVAAGSRAHESFSCSDQGVEIALTRHGLHAAPRDADLLRRFGYVLLDATTPEWWRRQHATRPRNPPTCSPTRTTWPVRAQNLTESVLTPANVNSSSFGKLRTLDDRRQGGCAAAVPVGAGGAGGRAQRRVRRDRKRHRLRVRRRHRRRAVAEVAARQRRDTE